MSKRCMVGLLTGVVLGAEGARIARKRRASAAKEIAGVPVLNYDLAYGALLETAEMAPSEHWVVVAKAGVSDARLRELCKSSSICERTGHPSAGGVPFFEVYATESELGKVLATAPGEMEYVEPDTMVYLSPDEIVEEAASASWGLDRIGAPSRSNSGEGAHIYVLDTGVRVTHTDFGGRATVGLDVTSGSVVVCDPTDLTCAADTQGHGTHCAGTAAGTIYGVAPGASVHSVKVLSDQGSGYSSWGWAALDWLATSGQRPAVASMSLGGRRQQASKTAVDAAVEAGITVVVAAGNNNDDACNKSPAFVPSAITVGSTTSTDERSSFSNFGSCVDIWAPGSHIVSATHGADTGATTMSGTSMACPHVSGAAALVLSENPLFLSEEVLAALKERGEKSAISELRPNDVNVLLWVGAGAAAVPAPTPAPTDMCPDFAFSWKPMFTGDCSCPIGSRCSLDGGSTKNCPSSFGVGGFFGMAFSQTCTDCRCFA